MSAEAGQREVEADLLLMLHERLVGCGNHSCYGTYTMDHTAVTMELSILVDGVFTIGISPWAHVTKTT